MVKFKINLVGPYPPPYGGVAIHVSNLINNLNNTFSIQLFSYGKNPFQKKGFRFIRNIYLKPLLWPYSLYKLNRWVSKNSIIHNHSSINAYPNYFIIKSFINFIRRKNLKLIDTIHDYTLIQRFEYLDFNNKKALIYYWKNAEIIITVSEPLKNFIENHGINSNKIYVISPLLPFIPEPCPDLVRKRIDSFILAHDIILSTIGAFSSFYDIDTIIKAFGILKQYYPKSGLILVKCGFLSDKKYERFLQNLICQQNLHNSILILKDIPHSCVLYILKKSNIFIRGAKEESFGLSKIEALLMGSYVISTPSGENKFMVNYSFKNSMDLVNKILEVLSQKNPIDLKEAKNYYQNMALTNLDKIKLLYEKYL